MERLKNIFFLWMVKTIYKINSNTTKFGRREPYVKRRLRLLEGIKDAARHNSKLSKAVVKKLPSYSKANGEANIVDIRDKD